VRQYIVVLYTPKFVTAVKPALEYSNNSMRRYTSVRYYAVNRSKTISTKLNIFMELLYGMESYSMQHHSLKLCIQLTKTSSSSSSLYVRQCVFSAILWTILLSHFDILMYVMSAQCALVALTWVIQLRQDITTDISTDYN